MAIWMATITVVQIFRLRHRLVLMAKIHGATNAKITINFAHPKGRSAIQLKLSIIYSSNCLSKKLTLFQKLKSALRAKNSPHVILMLLGLCHPLAPSHKPTRAILPKAWGESPS